MEGLEDVGKKYLWAADGSISVAIMEDSMEGPQKAEDSTTILHDPVTSLLVIYPKKIKSACPEMPIFPCSPQHCL